MEPPATHPPHDFTHEEALDYSQLSILPLYTPCNKALQSIV